MNDLLQRTNINIKILIIRRLLKSEANKPVGMAGKSEIGLCTILVKGAENWNLKYISSLHDILKKTKKKIFHFISLYNKRQYNEWDFMFGVR
jgi:hypothetical protein